jgi:Stress responsive A/B Barrel Domain
MIQHVVLLRWREDAPESDIEAAVSAMQELREIEGVMTIAFGRSSGPNGSGYRHALVAQLRDRAALAIYGPHPIHQRIAANLMPLAAEALIFDFEV